MSLKSFDKFCETLITAEPGSQKLILDERQKQVRSKLATEALAVYGIASFVNTVVMEELYKWCESYFAPMVLIAIICYIYWILRCHFSGALFGINGVFASKWTAGIVMVQAVCYSTMIFSDLAEGAAVVFDGMLSTNLVCGITVLLVFISAVAMMILAKKTEKADQSDTDKKD